MKPAPLPDCRQRTAHDCATAAWRTVYQYHYGRNKKTIDLSHPISGTDPSTLAAVIRHDAAWEVKSGAAMLADLKFYAETWRPPICLVTFPHHKDSHYIVVGGVCRNVVWFQCPENGWSSIGAAKFLDCWHGLGEYNAFRKWCLCTWPKVD